MIIDGDNNNNDFVLDGQKIEVVQEFEYLGSPRRDHSSTSRVTAPLKSNVDWQLQEGQLRKWSTFRRVEVF